MDRIDSLSLNLEKNNIDKIKELFPEAVEEGKINFDILRAMLGDEVDDSKEKYQFTWHGKSEAIKIAQSPSTATLRPDKELSKEWDNTENLYIEGDNLEVLKQLQKTYYGKIKVIYIDPPYNTGKDFIYHDDFRNSIDNYKEQTNQLHKSNPETGGRFHTNWLNLMYPRLLLAKNLLHDEGIMMISIDENEIAQMRMICDSVFGEKNRLSTHHIQVRYSNKTLNEKNDWQPVMEYCLIYAKNFTKFKPNKPYENYSLENFRYKINVSQPSETIHVKGRKVDVFRKGTWSIEEIEPSIDGLKETWVSGSIYTGTGNGQMVQNVIEPRIEYDGYGSLYKIYGLGEDGLGYRYFQGPQKEGANRSKMFSGVPLTKRKEIENGTAKKFFSISNIYDYSPDFGNIRHEGGIAFNSGKKPIKMLKEFINYCSDKEAIVLDFFSGSASTAHAVMDMNFEDGGKRRFILVQLPEKIDESDILYKGMNFKTICDVALKRINNVRQEILDKIGLFNNEIDLGYKVFKLDSTNIKPWNNENELDEKTIFEYGDVFKEDRSKEDILYEIMLKYGIFDKRVDEIKINGKTMYRVGKRYMIACLEDEITSEDIKAITELSPKTVVFKESGFKDDNDKINAENNLTKAGVEDVKCV